MHCVGLSEGGAGPEECSSAYIRGWRGLRIPERGVNGVPLCQSARDEGSTGARRSGEAGTSQTYSQIPQPGGCIRVASLLLSGSRSEALKGVSIKSLDQTSLTPEIWMSKRSPSV